MVSRLARPVARRARENLSARCEEWRGQTTEEVGGGMSSPPATLKPVLEAEMPHMSEIKARLGRAIKGAHTRLIITAREHKRRFGGAAVEADDLLQDGVLGAYQQLMREMSANPGQYADMACEDLQATIVRIASKVMRNKICDDHRKSYRRQPGAMTALAAEGFDDRLRESIAARESLQAIAASLSGTTLELFQLVMEHGQADVAFLARSIGLSVAQTYRLLSGIRQAAQVVTGFSARRSGTLRSPGTPADSDRRPPAPQDGFRRAA